MDYPDEDIGFDPTARRLCPDGTCTGVLDPSGRCHECGRNFDNVVALAFPSSELDLGEEPAALRFAGVADAGAQSFDPRRQLCPDGACTGVIAPSGTCSECGRTGTPRLQEV